MADIASLGIVVDTRQAQAAAVSLDELVAAGGRAEAATKKFGDAAVQAQSKTMTLTKAHIDAANASDEAANGFFKAGDSVQKLLNKYDPLGTKLRSLEADFNALNVAAAGGSLGTGHDAAIDKTYAALNAEISKTKGLMQAAGLTEGFGSAAAAADKSAFSTAGARRELIVLGHEAMTGNFSRMPGSFLVLAERMDLTQLLLSPMTLGFAAVGVALGAVAVAAIQGAHEVSEFNKQMALTGDYAGITKGQFNDMAASIAVSANAGIGTAKGVMQDMIATGAFAGTAFNVVANAAVAFAERSGESSDKVVKDFAKMADGVAKWALEHTKKYHDISAAQYQHIADLEQEGKASDAMVAAMGALDAAATRNVLNLGYVATAWHEAGKYLSFYWDLLKGIGRDATADELVHKTAVQLAGMQDQLKKANPDSPYYAALQANIKGVSAELDRLNKVRTDAEHGTAANSADAERQLAGIKALDLDKKLKDSIQSRADREKQEVADYVKNQATMLAAGGLTVDTEVQRAAVIAAIHNKYNQDAKAKISDADKGLKEYNDLIAKSTGLNANFTEQWDLLNAAYKGGRINVDQLTLAQAELLKQQPFSKDAAKQAADAANEQAKAEAALTKEIEKNIETLANAGRKEIDTLDAKIKKQTEANENIGKTKAQIDALNAVRQEQSALADEEAAQALRNAAIYAGKYHDAYIQYANDLDLVAKKKREVAGLDSQGAVLQSVADAAKKQAEEWKKGWDETDHLARKVFVEWGMQGTNMAKQIGDTLKHALLSAIYESTLKPIAFTIYNAVTGGPGAAASGISGINGLTGAGSLAAKLFGSSQTAGAWAAAPAVGAEVFGAGAAADSAFAGSVAGGFGGAGAAASSGLTAALSAVPIWGWAALGALALISLSSAHGGPKVSGSAGIWTGSDPNSNALDASLGGTLVGLQAQYAALAKITGASAAQFGLYASTDPQGKSPTLLGVNAAVNGQQVYSSFNTGVGRSQDEINAAIVDATTRAMIAALKASNLDSASAAFLAPLDTAASDIATLTAALNTLTTAKTATATLESLGITLGNFAQQSIDTQAALANAFGGAGAMATAFATFQQDFYSPAELVAAQTAALTKQFAALGLAMPTSEAGARALVEGWTDWSAIGQQNLVTALSLTDAYKKLSDSQGQAAKDTTAAATQTLSDALSGAFDNLKNAVSAQQKAINDAYTASAATINAKIQTATDALSKLSSLSSTLKSTLSQMNTTPGVGLSYGTASGQLSSALALAKSTGILPTADSLQDALKVVSQPSDGLYSSFLDYARAFAKQAATIQGLSDLTDDQTSLAQRTLDAANQQLTTLQQTRDSSLSALDAILAEAQAQVDAANGTTTAVMTLAQAVANFAHVVGVVNPGGTGGGGSVLQPGGSVGGFNPSLVQAAWDANPSAFSEVYKSALKNSQSSTTVDGIFGVPIGTALAEALKYGLPSFDVGTNSLQRNMVIQAHAGEEITPRPFVDLQRAAREETNELLRRLTQSNADMKDALSTANDELAEIKKENIRIRNVLEKSDTIGPAPSRAAL